MNEKSKFQSLAQQDYSHYNSIFNYLENPELTRQYQAPVSWLVAYNLFSMQADKIIYDAPPSAAYHD